MSINANAKFMNAITGRIADFELVSVRDVDAKELETISDMGAFGHGFSIKIMKCSFRYIDSWAKELVYDNGLKYLISKMSYKGRDGNLQTIEQRILTSDYSNPPIVNVIINQDKKAIEQLLIDSNSKDEIFPYELKCIDIERTIIYVNNECGSVFETYKNLHTKKLMLEKYQQYYPISDYKENDDNLMRLCGCGSRNLEIVYDKNEPIFAQLSDKYKVEMAGFDPNSALDAKIIVGIINDEVDVIVKEIQTSIDEYLNKSIQKKLKPSSNE